MIDHLRRNYTSPIYIAYTIFMYICTEKFVFNFYRCIVTIIESNPTIESALLLYSFRNRNEESRHDMNLIKKQKKKSNLLQSLEGKKYVFYVVNANVLSALKNAGGARYHLLFYNIL